MRIDAISIGDRPPDDLNVIIEVPLGSAKPSPAPPHSDLSLETGPVPSDP